MKKVLIPFALMAGMFVSACGMPNCDALKKQCDACKGTLATTCWSAHTTYTTVGGSAGDASCKAIIDAKTYQAPCG